MSYEGGRGTGGVGAFWLVVLATECFGLTAGVRAWWLFSHWEIGSPEPFFRMAWLGPVFVAAAGLAALMARRNGLRFEALANLPLLALLIQPLKPWFYLSNSQILPTLPFCIAAALLTRCVIARAWPSAAAVRRILDSFAVAPPLRQSLAVFTTAFLVYAFLSSNLVFPVFPFTGDEPHYLILTHSIVHEGDTNLYDNYYLNKDYRLFYPGELVPHTHARDRIRQQSYSTHMPATAATLVPFYWPAVHLPSEWMHFFIRAAMSFYTALLVAQAFLLMRSLFDNARIALAGTALLALSPPLLFYSRCVYPEVFAGLLMVVALRVIIERRGAWGYLTASIALALMPWFGTKYAIFAIVFTGVFFWLRLRERDRGFTTYVVFLVPLALSALIMLGFLKHYYGEYSPQAIYHPPWNRPAEGEFPETAVESLLNRSRALLGYFYDQRVGLLVFAPVYIMAFPGALLLLRQRRREGGTLLTITVFYTLFYAYNMSWGGQAPPSRPLVSITPLLATFAAAFMSWAAGRWRVLRDSLIALTMISAVVLLSNSHLLYDTISNHDWQGRSLFLGYLSNPYVDLTRFVPQFLERVHFNYAATFGWLAVFVAFMAAFFLAPLRPDSATDNTRMRCGLIFLAALTISTLNLLEPGCVIKGPGEVVGNARIHRLDSLNYGPELGGFWTKGGRSTSILIEQDRRLAAINVALRPVAQNQVTLWAYDRKLMDAQDIAGPIEQQVTLPWSYRWGSRFLYSMTFRTRVGQAPGGGDSRSLGVFVELEPLDGAAEGY